MEAMKSTTTESADMRTAMVCTYVVSGRWGRVIYLKKRLCYQYNQYCAFNSCCRDCRIKAARITLTFIQEVISALKAMDVAVITKKHVCASFFVALC